MKDKTIHCLKLCSLPMEERIPYLTFMCMRYSQKAVYAKLHELARKGYIEYGTSIRCAWLTDKGKSTLGNINLTL